jgi:putative mRNA 3-end processing factor
MSLLEFTNKGIYCPTADVYIDPWKKVPKALITHAHSDHARSGHKSYICTNETLPILKLRLGKSIGVAGKEFGESFGINGVKFSFHAAGHIIGSAQIRAEYKGEIWVVSGDYKIENDGISEQFEPIKCHHFITECTFGLPAYQWQPQEKIFDQINNWWSVNADLNTTSVISAYSLGKAQRVIQNVNHQIGPIYTHPTVENINNSFREIGIPLQKTLLLTKKVSAKNLERALIVTPSGAALDEYIKSVKNISTASASGWMMSRGMRRRGNFDRGFVLSDHADWPGLNQAIKETGAHHIYPTHGYTQSFSRWLNEQGYETNVVKTQYEGEPGL